MFAKKFTARAMIVIALAAATTFVSFAPPPMHAQAAARGAQALSPRQQLLHTAVDEAYAKYKSDTKGKNADYIPYLAKVDSNLFGISVVTTDGLVYSVGDLNYSFSIQSISKVYTLALAMDELGADAVFAKIGSEPTGRPFNSPSAVVDMPTHTGNPLVNAGAIATVSLIPAKTAAEKWNKILSFYGDVAGEKLTLIDEVYKSEAATNQGNRALAALLLKYERLYADPLESVDVYTKQCSVGVNTKQLGMMAATLANNGKNPATGKQVIKSENIPHILATMTSAGLYDGSGGWAWSVGLPAKSGVGGGIIAVVPGQGAITVFSPRLDEAGNSVKAQEVISYIATKMNLNLYDTAPDSMK
jgi:glutaminase